MAAQLILLAAAIVQASSMEFEGNRPNLSEWKASQKNATESAAAIAAREAKMAAVNKVVDMLVGVQTKTLAEGEEEAKTYNKFACFCKDMTAEKKKNIDHGEDEKSRLTSHIQNLETDREDLDKDIKQFTGEIEDAEEEMRIAEEKRAKTAAIFAKNSADISNAIGGLEEATKVLKASDISKASLLQMQGTSDKVRDAVLLADAMGLVRAQDKNVAAVFLQQAPDNIVPTEDYKFHSDAIIKTLENLMVSLTNEKNEIDAAEVKSIAEFDIYMQDKNNYVKAKKLDLENAEKEKARTTGEIAEATAELTEVSATLLDDQEYLKELAQGCSDKARTWDKRTEVRQDELYVLTEVIGIIKGMVSEKTSAATIRFNQQGVVVKLAEAISSNPDAMDAIEAGAEMEEAGAASFLQTVQVKGSASKSLRGKGPDDGSIARTQIVDLLRSQSEHLHSTVLARLASQIQTAADPFAKIKKLIQDLIEKMLAEAANEANQKGWCDKAIADATQKRTYAAQEIEELNSQMAELEATRDTLTEDLATLADEIAELKSARDKAKTMRKTEKAENAATVLEAQEGLAAVDMAISILDKFYKTAAKATVSLAQGPFDGDAPDAGFKNFEAYTGQQGEASGIVGMMEVMKSDFERTIAETEAAEAEAEQEHLEFMTETGKSLAQKTTAESIKTKQKDDTLEKLNDADGDLQSQTNKLETSIKELMELQPTCIDTGMSYEERVARREQEIAALKQALCILKAYQEYGPDGLSDAC